MALEFPVGAEVPESLRHLKLRTSLLDVLERAFGARAAVGSDQFVYFSASNPKRCIAPDVFVRLGAPGVDITSWKTWERGTPELAVEIVSPNERPWVDQLADYHDAGFVEVVRFYVDAAPGSRIRAWDRVDGDLVERVVEGDRTPCAVLGGTWVVAPTAGYPVGLRLEDERAELWLSGVEAAERRVAELEAELGRRR